MQCCRHWVSSKKQRCPWTPFTATWSWQHMLDLRTGLLPCSCWTGYRRWRSKRMWLCEVLMGKGLRGQLDLVQINEKRTKQNRKNFVLIKINTKSMNRRLDIYTHTYIYICIQYIFIQLSHGDTAIPSSKKSYQYWNLAPRLCHSTQPFQPVRCGLQPSTS